MFGEPVPVLSRRRAMLLIVRFFTSLLILSLAFAASARGQVANRLPLETRLLADAADGVLDRFNLPSACLIAAGVSDERELAKLRSRLAALMCSLDQAVTSHLPASERAKHVHQRLHERVLTGDYDEQATDLRRTLAGGDYNCLSALVLLAARAGGER